MLVRFSLYGFLKNQQFFDPFLILAFLEKGLTFTQIGLLIGFREIGVFLLEIPTGAVADVSGRRRAMILSHLAYIGAFLLFASAERMGPLLVAMAAFSLGEAFRTGTHKAIIFDWLARQGRSDEKTRVYGFTRSWSKLGSAVSVVVATVLVFATEQYSTIFYFSIVPYTANIVNFLGYPRELDGPRTAKPRLSEVLRTLQSAVLDSLRRPVLRRLLVESMGFEGTFKVCKDYAQPVIRAMALALPFLVGLADRQRTAVLIGSVYFVLYLLSSFSSRHAADLARWAGGEVRGARRLWVANAGIFSMLTAGVLLGRLGVAVGAFVALALAQNLWRPILISRFADQTSPAQAATMLSVESQGKNLFAAALAPLLGLVVDLMPDAYRFLPVGLVGLAVASIMLATGRRGD